MTNYSILSRITITLIVIGSFSSCVVRRTAYQQEIANTPIVQAPLVADLQVDPKSKVEATYRSLKDNNGAWDGTDSQAKTSALYLAMEQNGCDVIVNPVFEMTRLSRKRIDVKVKGMCGKYTDIRKPNLEDVTLLQELEEAHPMFAPSTSVLLTNQNGVDIKRVATPSASKKTPKSPEEKRRKRGAIIGGIIGGVVGLATLLGILL